MAQNDFSDDGEHHHAEQKRDSQPFPYSSSVDRTLAVGVLMQGCCFSCCRFRSIKDYRRFLLSDAQTQPVTGKSRISLPMVYSARVREAADGILTRA